MNDRKYLIGLSLVILLSVLFRFHSLETIPAWDFDEGYNMRYSYDLLNGEMLWFAIKYTFIPHPPLFFMAYALVIKFFGVGVYTIRSLTGFYGVLTTLLLYLLGREMFNRKVGLTAAFIYAVTPEVVFWNRLGYANNQFILVSTIALYFIHRHSKTFKERNLYFGCFFAGMSVLTEYTGLFNVAAIAIFLYIYDRKNVLKAVMLSLAPLAVFFMFMLYASPEYFIFDIKYQLSRFVNPLKIGSGVIFLYLLYRLRKKISGFYRPIIASINQDIIFYVAAASLSVFLATESDFWHATTFLFLMGFFGFCFMPSFLIERERERRLLLLFLLFNLLSMLVLSRADHMTMVIYPYVSLALACLLYITYSRSVVELPWILRRFNLKPSRKVLFAIVFYPLFISLCISTYLFLLGNISTETLEEDFAVAEYINQHTGKEDLVLTYSWMFPLISKARVSLLTQSLAYEGIPIAYYSGEFPKDRFAFNTSYRRAKFLVASNHTLDWLLNETGANETVICLEGWDKTKVAGFLIYRNPDYNSQ